MQVIGLFHRDPEQRAKANVYHGMIVMVGVMCFELDRPVLTRVVDASHEWLCGQGARLEASRDKLLGPGGCRASLEGMGEARVGKEVSSLRARIG